MRTACANQPHRTLIRESENWSDTFSFQELSHIMDSDGNMRKKADKALEYCIRNLGQPASVGSSRCVFWFCDSLVLKLAYGKMFLAGMHQNKSEYNIYVKEQSMIFPKIFGVDKNFLFLLSEKVIPAKESDFEMVFGIPYMRFYKQNTEKVPDENGGDKEIGFNDYFNPLMDGYHSYNGYTMWNLISYIEDTYAEKRYEKDDKAERLIDSSPWLTSLKEIVANNGLSDLHLGNFGMVNRDGKPMIVLLDSGLDTESFNKFYM